MSPAPAGVLPACLTLLPVVLGVSQVCAMPPKATPGFDCTLAASSTERAICAACHAAYQTLFDTAHLATASDGATGLGTLNARGLGGIMEGALQQADGNVRVALIDGEEVHYRSSDASTAATTPAWFDDWRGRFADTPVRLMSMPGQPLGERAIPGSRGH